MNGKTESRASHPSNSGLGDLIGKCTAIQEVYDLILLVANGDASVTISGESGTGKELVARSIHAHSGRRNMPFVPVNCGGFPEHLFESELFGHEKGAFTGAHRRKSGLIEFAQGGTFFLDEICELSLPLQVKLLRLLQDRKVRRVGGTELIDVDVRIISASNRNLDEAVKEGQLREDLYYRLNVISINIPPLRERRLDIPLLSGHFVEKYAKMTPKQINGISDEALDLLVNYDWPGNVRELENVIERAIALARTNRVLTEDLPESIKAASTVREDISNSLPLKEAKEAIIASFEKDYIVQKLIRHNGNITHAADESGVNRRTFHRLLNRYKINPKNCKS